MNQPPPFPAARLLSAVLATSVLLPVASASDLELSGVTDLTLPYGDSFAIEVTAGPGLGTLVYLDEGPGPVSAFGEVLPLDLSPNLKLLTAGVTDGAGQWALTWPTPQDPGLSGFDVYFGALVLDPSDPNGLDPSNGAVLRLVPPVGAGADQGALVGRAVVLDGSDAATVDGQVPAGTTLLWEFVTGPAGSTASLETPDQVFASFTPDLPGDYVVRLTSTNGGATAQATTTVHAWDLTLTTPLAGSYQPAGQVTLAGVLTGPAPASFTVDGTPVTLGPFGSFGPLQVTFDGAADFDHVLFEVTHPDGTQARRRDTVALAQPAWVAFGADDSAVAHLDGLGLATLAQGVEQDLESQDLSVYVTAIPPTQVANDEGLFGFTIFSATVDMTGMTWNPDMSLVLAPTPAGVDGVATLASVKVTFDVWGEILEIPYSLTGDSTSNGVDISALLTLTTSGGDLDVQVSGVTVNLSGFGFNLNGFLGSLAELFLIESWVKDQVVDVMEQEVGDQIGPILVEMLQAFDFSLDLGPELGLDAVVDVDFANAAHSSHGVTLDLDAGVTVGIPAPGAPSVSLYPSTPAAPVNFSPLTPTGQTYGGSLAASDDFLNLILAGLTEAGLLEGDLTDLFSATGGGAGSVPTTEVLAVLFPGAGFQLFPAGTEVDLAAHGVLPPRITETPGGPGLARLELAGLEVSLGVPTAAGSVPVLLLALDGEADLNLVVEPDGTLAATLLDSTFGPTVLAGFPGSNVASLQAGSDFLVALLLPQLTEALGTIPVPSLDQEGVTLTTDEVGLMGGGFLGFWGGMTYSPAP